MSNCVKKYFSYKFTHKIGFVANDKWDKRLVSTCYITYLYHLAENKSRKKYLQNAVVVSFPRIKPPYVFQFQNVKSSPQIVQKSSSEHFLMPIYTHIYILNFSFPTCFKFR